MASKKYKTEQEARAKVLELVKDARIAMLASLGSDGRWHSRPMATGKTFLDGDLWFMTDARSEKVGDLAIDSDVLLSYANESDNSYVSISGVAEVVHDSGKVKELWTEPTRTWFPDGPDDPNIALIRVRIDSAEYWDAPSAAMINIIGYAKAWATGDRPKDVAEHRKVDF